MRSAHQGAPPTQPSRPWWFNCHPPRELEKGTKNSHTLACDNPVPSYLIFLCFLFHIFFPSALHRRVFWPYRLYSLPCGQPAKISTNAAYTYSCQLRQADRQVAFSRPQMWSQIVCSSTLASCPQLGRFPLWLIYFGPAAQADTHTGLKLNLIPWRNSSIRCRSRRRILV